MPLVTELKQKYKGKWLAIEVSRYEDHEPVEGKLLLHDRDRQKLWQKLKLSPSKRIYVTYAGPLIEEGYAVAF